MKYICFGYYDKGKFDGMTEAERNAMFDTCLEYDDHLRANGNWGGGEALQGPETALTLHSKDGKVVATDGPYVLVVNPKLDVKTVQELVALSKAKPGTINYSSFGIGSMAQLNLEAFNHRMGTDMLHVPYKGAAPAAQAEDG